MAKTYNQELDRLVERTKNVTQKISVAVLFDGYSLNDYGVVDVIFSEDIRRRVPELVDLALDKATPLFATKFDAEDTMWILLEWRSSESNEEEYVFSPKERELIHKDQIDDLTADIILALIRDASAT